METNEKLTTAQINFLFDYCKSQNVKYYDVQLELVDHMAACIEETIGTSNGSFGEAFASVKLQFNKKTFRNLVRSKKRYVYKNLLRHFIAECKSFLTWPRMLITLCLGIIIFSSPADESLVQIYPALLLSFFYISLFFNGSIIGKNGTRQVTSLISMDIVKFSQGIAIFLISSLFSGASYLVKKASLFNNNAFLLKFIWLILIIMSLSFYFIALRTNKQIRKQYPQAFLQ